MTPQEELDLLASASAAVDVSARDAQRRMLELIRGGMAPRDAVEQALQEFGADFGDTLAEALSRINQASIGQADALAMRVGQVNLSARLYAEAVAVSAEVQAIVQAHVAGFQNARELALRLFEGYGFRDPAAEPLKIRPSENRLPKYLRELAADPKTASELDRAMARLQVNGLSSQALRAAYTEALDAIDAIAEGRGTAIMEKRLQTALYERVRYFATRIAQTELHRAYMEREARILMGDKDVEFVQVRRAPGRHDPCICTLFTGRDRYGLGEGIYPKKRAPLPPYHPFCRCSVSPRLDLTGKPVPEEREGADVSFLQRIGETTAARVMGSQAKRDQVLRGDPAEAVASTGRNDAYRIRTVGSVAGG